MSGKSSAGVDSNNMLAAIRYGADKVFRGDGATITDDDIDAIINRGKEKTAAMKKVLEEKAQGDMTDEKKDALITPLIFPTFLARQAADQACQQGVADGFVQPSALTVDFGLGCSQTVNIAVKSVEVRASLKALVEEFLKIGYGPLMKSLKNSFVRESDRLLPSDLILMTYISALSMQYHRLMLEKRIEQDKSNTVTFDVSASAECGIGVCLDLWSFRFYTKNIINYTDSKKWVELGISLATFKEMIMTVSRMFIKGSPSVQAWSSRLIGIVFYEREIMVGSFSHFFPLSLFVITCNCIATTTKTDSSFPPSHFLSLSISIYLYLLLPLFIAGSNSNTAHELPQEKKLCHHLVYY